MTPLQDVPRVLGPSHTLELERAIEQSMVDLHKRHVGRGPRTARAYLAEEMVTVLMSEVLTRSEQTLLNAGRGDRVKSSRDGLLEALEVDAAAVIETETGRSVVATMSATSLEPDLATFTFVFGSRQEGRISEASKLA